MAYGAYHPRNPRGQQRDKLFREALRMQLAQAGENLKALREIADVLIAEAKAGNIQAIRELADRLDGKPVQMLEPVAAASGERRKLTYEIVHVTETGERIEDPEGSVVEVEYRKIKTVNGNGHDHADGESNTANGNGHGRRE
jgi:ribosomal protein L17